MNSKNNSRVNKTWSQSEIKFLEKNYLILSSQKIAEALNRNPNGIETKAFSLNLYSRTLKKIQTLPTLTETEKAYIAGFFDGEGCATVDLAWKKKQPRYANFKLCFSNVHKGVLKWIAAKIYWGKWKQREVQLYGSRTKSYPNFLKFYRLEIHDRFRVEQLLKTMLPYLHVKKTIVQKILEFYQLHPVMTTLSLSDWKKILEIKNLIKTNRAPHVHSCQRLARFIKELEAKESSQVNI